MKYFVLILKHWSLQIPFVKNSSDSWHKFCYMILNLTLKVSTIEALGEIFEEVLLTLKKDLQESKD